MWIRAKANFLNLDRAESVEFDEEGIVIFWAGWEPSSERTEHVPLHETHLATVQDALAKSMEAGRRVLDITQWMPR